MENTLISLDFKLPSPIQTIADEYTEAAGISLHIKREDLIHTQISGNKYRKLLYNLQEAQSQQASALLTFGGAHSNHIYATAAAGYLNNLQTIGIIRGEETLPTNETLAFAQTCGMELQYMSRSHYRHKADTVFLQKLRDKFGEHLYIVPEGGSNAQAVKGCTDIIRELQTQDGGIPFNYVACACGTGGTLAGIVAGLEQYRYPAKALGFAVLKGADFLHTDIAQLLHAYTQRYAPEVSIENYRNRYELQLDYHFGGYAKQKPDLVNFIQWFEAHHGIKIEFVYTGKILFGIYHLIKQKFFKKGEKLLILHTGGLRN